MASVGFASRSQAQDRGAVIRVRVIDTASAPIADAQLSIEDGESRLAAGVSDANGAFAARLPIRARDYDLVVRRIGFVRQDRMFRPQPDDTLRFTIVLPPAAAVLNPVVVSAEVSAKQRAYNIDADAIASSNRPLFDLNDVIRKLRPDMRTSVAPEICGALPASPGPPLRAIRVNGIAVPIFADGYVDSASTANNVDWVTQQITDVLSTIKPEHVAEMHYLDCFDTGPLGIAGTNTLYVVLKPGVAYQFGRGSYVLPAHAMRAARAGAADDGGAQNPAPRSLPPGRIIGIFHAYCATPLAGVAVADSVTGTVALSPKSGLVLMGGLPQGSSRVGLSKEGFADTTFVLALGPSDTVPVLMRPLSLADTARCH